MNFYTEPLGDLLKHFDADPQKGLNQAQLEQARQKYGKNVLREQKKPSLLMRFLAQFKDTMIIILIIAAIISFFVAAQSGETREFLEPALILAIVILNAIMGMMQESKAEKAMEALKSMSAPHARVLRNGREAVIDASDLVPGDIILVEAGDFVPADARLIESASLKSEESALTGESVPVEKDAQAAVAEGAPLGDRVNMLYSGCSVTYGRGRAIVTATGMDTEMGRIAGLLESADDTQTPLQHKLARMGKLLGIVALAACAVIFVVGLLNNIPVLEIFMTSVSLAVSAIPEGLPAIVTVVLSIGIQRMAKKNAIIRRLPAVETLGSASIICSDKTGTLTQNRMTLTRAYAVDGRRTEEISANCSDAVRRLLSMATLCCDGSIEMENGKEKHIGDPTETAIVAAAAKNGITKAALNRKYPRLAEIPFDSDRKLMSTLHDIDGTPTLFTKGAIDVLLDRSKWLLTREGKVELTPERKETIARVNMELSMEGLRVLAFAYKELDAVRPLTLDDENEFTFIGLISMIDPPRPEAIQAVADAKQGGIRTVMITGDHKVTATAIAKQLGIFLEGDEALSGVELDQMSDADLDERLEHISVYARVSPEHKIRIVNAWQRKGKIVSMTGDGVNDAPALKKADIGVAMGITGTEVSKDAASMILADDNFATIVKAVVNGRSVYTNIKNAIQFLLSGNTAGIFCVLYASLLALPVPFQPVHLLFINLLTDSLPAIAIGMEPARKGLLKQKPRDPHASLFANGFAVSMVFYGVLVGGITLLAYALGEYVLSDPDMADGTANTMAFATLVFCELTRAFAVRSEKRSIFQIGVFSNKTMNIAFVVGLGLQLCVLFIPPLQSIFSITSLPAQDWVIVVALGLCPLIISEITKAVSRARDKGN